MVDTADDFHKELLHALKQDALALDEAAFARRHEGWWLLGELPAEKNDDEWSFTTDVRMFDHRGPAGRSVGGSQASAGATRLLWKVEKSDRNTWKRRISVGRATNNDIIIRHHSVSKLHAHFHFGTLVSIKLRKSGGLLLSDVGSANGTTVDGENLPQDDPVPVGAGSRVDFGEIHCQLFDAKALYKRLRSILL